MAMDLTLLDDPLILSILFHPRPARAGTSRFAGAQDGTIPVGGGVELGYRLYPHRSGEAVILYFHGNGEIAPDYDEIAPEYHRAGASLLVIDYRGYGWSSGQPKASTMLQDAEAVASAVPDLLRGAGLGADRLFMMGRSLGSALAIHAVYQSPHSFKGLIIESGFARTIPLLARLGLPTELGTNLPDPIGNLWKISEITLPLLVIHGELDYLIPVSSGQALYNASPAEDKRILRIERAGHNDLLFRDPEAYFDAIKQFLADVA